MNKADEINQAEKRRIMLEERRTPHISRPCDSQRR